MKAEKTHTGYLSMRTEPDFVELIDEWRAQQRPILTRSEAIRKLVSYAFETKAHWKEQVV